MKHELGTHSVRMRGAAAGGTGGARVGALVCAAALLISAGAEAQPAADKPAAEPAPAGEATAREPRAAASPGGAAAEQAAGFDQALRQRIARPGGLTAKQASARAVASSSELKQSAAELRSAQADDDQAAAGYLPRVALTARYTRLSEVGSSSLGTLVATTQPGLVAPGQPLFGVDVGFPQILDQYLLQANVVVPLTDYFLRTNHLNAATAHGVEAAKYRQQVAQRSAALYAQLSYYAWAQARLSAVVATRTLEQAQAHYRVADVAHQAGALTRAELLRFDAQVATAELMLERARSAEEINEDALRSWLHDPDTKRYAIGEDLMAPLPPLKRSGARALREKAQRQRPEFLALQQSEKALGEQRKGVKASTLPRLDAFGNAYYANPTQRQFPQKDAWTASWDAGLQLTYVINDIPSANASARSLEAKQSALRAQQASLRDLLRREVNQARRSALEADVALRLAARGLEASEEAYRATLLQFRADRIRSVELTDANTALLRARLELVAAHINQRVSRVRLAYALGDPL